jgi:hypothetical protein
LSVRHAYSHFAAVLRVAVCCFCPVHCIHPFVPSFTKTPNTQIKLSRYGLRPSRPAYLQR